MIVVDGDESTNDTCLMMANGASGVDVINDGEIDSNFQDASSNLFNSLLDTCISAVSMGVQALNVIYRISDIRAASPMPLEELAQEAGTADEDDLPDVEE